MNHDTERALDKAAAILAGARSVIAFTGAGISAESGVPTFRGAGGIWERYDERHLELGYFRAHPELAWPTIRDIFYAFASPDGERPPFQPNDAHRVLAAWEQQGILSFTVTQNIDGLHAAAGSRRLSEFHGTTATLSCMRCGARVPSARELLETLPPRCPCGGIYKPDFTFFGEGIDPAASSSAYDAARKADVCLVIGSTGLVYPAATIPRVVAGGGGTVIEVNPEPSTFTDDITGVFLPMGASEALVALDQRLRGTATP
ncbi:MAG TPA: Sir2 family NAD-dependent protein deacetylase [Spirochaetales bacterium]|nr:Sir2 family NAD-dependent protein deacetylase [Spirochaetales bacterium]